MTISARKSTVASDEGVDFVRACRQALAHLAGGYLYFLPGVAVTWFLTESAARAVPAPLVATRPLLCLFASVLYSAAAARAAGAPPVRLQEVDPVPGHGRGAVSTAALFANAFSPADQGQTDVGKRR